MPDWFHARPTYFLCLGDNKKHRQRNQRSIVFARLYQNSACREYGTPGRLSPEQIESADMVAQGGQGRPRRKTPEVFPQRRLQRWKNLQEINLSTIAHF